jgi:lipopolysaccharide heptosyltransferase III
MKKIKMIRIYLQRFSYFLLQSVCFKKNPVSVKKILLVRLNHIGDLLITLPTIFSIKQFYPDAQITLVTGVWNRGLAEFQKQLFDEIIYYNKKENCRSENQIMDRETKKDIFKKLKTDSYDLCFDFDGAWDFFQFYLIGGVKCLSSVSFLRFHQNLEQIGFSKSRYRYDIHAQHESDNIFETANVLEIPDRRKDFAISVSEETDKKVSEYFSALNGAKTVGIHPIASIPEKMWTAKGFSSVADFLIEKGFSVVIFGSPADKEYIAEISSAMKYKNSVNTAADFSLGEFITGVSKCDYFISLDSLAQHVVQYFNKTAIVIYLIENSVRWSSDRETLIRLLTDTSDKSIKKVIDEIDTKFCL